MDKLSKYNWQLFCNIASHYMNQFCLVHWGQMFEFMFCNEMVSSWLQKFHSPGSHFCKFFLSAVFRFLSDQHPSQSPKNSLIWSFSSSFLLTTFSLNICLLSPVWHVWLPLSSPVQSLGTDFSHSTERTAEPVSCLLVLASCYSSHPLPGKGIARRIVLSRSLTWHMLNPQSMYLLNFNKVLLGRGLRVLQEQALLIVASLTSLLSWCRISNPALQHGDISNSFQKMGGNLYFFLL